MAKTIRHTRQIFTIKDVHSNESATGDAHFVIQVLKIMHEDAPAYCRDDVDQAINQAAAALLSDNLPDAGTMTYLGLEATRRD